MSYGYILFVFLASLVLNASPIHVHAVDATGTPVPISQVTGTPAPGTQSTLTLTPQVSSSTTITATPSITSTIYLTPTPPSTPKSTATISATKTVTPTLQVGTPTATLAPLINFQPREAVRDVAPRLLSAAIIILIGWGLALLARKLVFKALFQIHPEVRLFISRLAFIGVWVGAFIWALSVMQVYIATLATILGSLGLIISLSSQDLAKNLVAGVYLLIERPFGVGDYITVGAYSGKVAIVDLRMTLLDAENGEQVIVPNSLIMSQVVLKERNQNQPNSRDRGEK